MKKRILSIILSIVMLVSLLPTTALAVEPPEAKWGTSTEDLPGSGKLMDAFRANEEVNYIQLRSNVTYTETMPDFYGISYNDGLIFDFNGFKITQFDDLFINNSTVTIIDSGEGGGIVADEESGGIEVDENADVTIEGGSFSGGYCGVTVLADGTLDITGGEINVSHMGVDVCGGEVSIKDGEIYGGMYGVWATAGNTAVSADAKISGGEIGILIEIYGKVTLSGGDIHGEVVDICIATDDVRTDDVLTIDGTLSDTYSFAFYEGAVELPDAEGDAPVPFAAAGQDVTLNADNFTFAGLTSYDDDGNLLITPCNNLAVAVSEDGTKLQLEYRETPHSHPVCGATCAHEDGHSTVDSWTELTASDVSNGTLNGGSYYLGENITVTKEVAISGEVNLCLNGYSIENSTGSTIQTTIQVSSGATLNICDCTTGGTAGKIENTNNSTGSGTTTYGIYNSGTVNVYGGTISATTAATTTTAGSGSGIYNYSGQVTVVGTGAVVSGTFYGIYSTGGTVSVSDGKVSGKYGIYNKGEVIVGGEIAVTGTECGISNSGTVSISGGTVQATGSSGHGIYSTGGTVSVSGGTVQATGSNGRGIYNSGGAVSVSDGTVSGLTYGVYASGTGDITISGGEVSARNSASNSNSYGVYRFGSGAVEITGGTVSGKNGVYLYGSGNVTVSGGTVTGNDSGIYGYGIYLHSSSTGDVAVDGGTVSGTAYGVYTTRGSSGSVTVSGDADISGAQSGILHYGQGTVTVSGGTVKSPQRVNGTTSSGIKILPGSGNTTVSGGTVSGMDYGIYNGGTLTLSNAPTITGDTADIHLDSGKIITISGALTYTEENAISVKMDSAGTFTSGWTEQMGENADYDSYFTSKNEGYTVQPDGSGELKLAEPPAAETHSHPICGATCTHDGGHSTPESWTKLTASDLSNGTLSLADGNSYYLGEDISVSASVEISGTVNLCLNGHKVSAEGGYFDVSGTLNLCSCEENGIIKRTTTTNALISADAGATANLYNVTLDGGAVWSGTEDIVLERGTTNSGISSSAPLIDAGYQHTAGGHITLNSGVVSQNNECSDAGDGGAITLGENGTLVINGATICNNAKTGGNAGAIKAYTGAQITLNSGEIYGNEAYKHGGAIQIFGGDSTDKAVVVFTMNGGTIRNNKANGVGGGIAVSDYSQFIMNGGSIIENATTESQKRGGGVGFADANTTMSISGNAVISGNTAGGTSANNLYIGANLCNKLTVGTMGNSADIGVTMANKPGTFTTGGATYVDDNYFTSDDTTYEVADDGNGNLKLAAKTIAVTGVTLNKSSTSITVGGTEQLTATVLPDNATDKTVAWSSNDGSIVTVDSNGNITAQNVGTTTITATAGGKTATCTVTVNAKALSASNVTLSQDSFTYDGSAKTPTVTVKDGDTVLTEGTDYTVNYSDNTNAGTGKVTVTFTGNYSGRAEKNFTISKANQEGFAITGKPTGDIAYGGSFTLSTAGGSGDSAVSWTVTTGSQYAKIDESGKVTVKGVGTVTITATKAESTNYKTATDTYTFTSVKATPVLGTVSVSGVVKDTTAPAAVVLTKTAGPEGTFVITDAAMLANKSTYNWTFTPTDTVNYTTITGTVEIEVADTQAPSATITVDTKEWKEKLNNITFGIFFDNTQTVTITYADNDNGSGIETVQYLLSDAAITDFTNVSWNTYNGAFSINPDSKVVIYAKVTDNDGNSIIVNSNGIVLDKTAPVLSSITDGETYYGNKTFAVNDALAGVNAVTVDGTAVTLNNGEHTIVADNAQHTIVVTDNAGNATTYTVTVYKIYTVTYKADGQVVSSQSVNHGADATAPAIPTKDGYTQTAPYWDKDGKNITTDTEINAVYTINEYTVTYKADGVVVDTQTIEHGANATPPTVPAKEGYTQIAPVWDKDGKNITVDTEINAVYTINKYTVTYVADGETISTQTIEHGADATAPAVPKKVGYTQVAPYWDKDGKNITTNTTITAVYTINKYTVTYKADGQVVDTQTIEHGANATPPTVPAKEGYTQTAPAWDKDGKNITVDTEINAVYTINKYTVTYVADGETISTQTIEHGADATVPAIPTKEGYTQTAPYWNKDGTNITADTVINAVYTINTYTVTYVIDGEVVDTQTVEHGTKIAEPTAPTKDKANFAGWFSDSDCTKAWNFAKDTVTADLTLYAKWSDVPVFHISGKVEQETDVENVTTPVANATVKLMLGTTLVATETTDENGLFYFGGQVEGDYNLVVEYGEPQNQKTVTVLVAIHGNDAEGLEVTLPASVTNSIVKHEPAADGKDSVAAGTLVGGLDAVAETVREQAEKDVDTSSGVDASEVIAKVEVTLTVKDTPPVTGTPTAGTEAAKQQAQQKAIQQKAGGKQLVFFDLSVVKSVTDNNDQTTVSRISDTGSLLEIRIPFDSGNKWGITIYRYHGDKAEVLAAVREGSTTEGFWVGDDGYIHIYTKKFSTYAVGYTVPSYGYFVPVTPDTVTSADTFDAGIVVYVTMSMLAATGSAVVIGKKRKEEN